MDRKYNDGLAHIGVEYLNSLKDSLLATTNLSKLWKMRLVKLKFPFTGSTSWKKTVENTVNELSRVT